MNRLIFFSVDSCDSAAKLSSSVLVLKYISFNCKQQVGCIHDCQVSMATYASQVGLTILHFDLGCNCKYMYRCSQGHMP